MGNDVSSSEDSGQSHFNQRLQKDFVFVREKKDPRFEIYKEKGHDRYIFLKGHWCGDEDNYNQFLRQCNKRIKINHPNVLRMIGFNQHSETQICGDFSKINCYYEYYSLNLEKELDKRLPEQKFFTEPEIWYLLDSIVNACSFFESNKIYHGDIRPTNVLLTVQGQVKIADNGIVNQAKNGYIKALFDGETPYLAPLLMNALAHKEKKPSHNQFKSDVYSLGMTMLECCMLYKSLSFYDYSSCELRYNLIEEFLNKARLIYSGFLVNLIREMLNREEFQRPTFHEIGAILAPYRQQIQTLTPFSADYITVKQNFVHPDQQLILQSGVVTNPSVFYQIGPANGQGINLLNQSLSVVQSTPALSTVKYSPDKSYLAHSKLVFQQSGAPTNFTQSIVTPQGNQSYQQVATPAVFSPNQSTVNYQMNGSAQPLQIQQLIGQQIPQQQIQQQQQLLQSQQQQQQIQQLSQPQQQQVQQQQPYQQQQQLASQQPNAANNSLGQIVMMAPPANPNSYAQNPSLSSTNTFGASSIPANQLVQQLQPGQPLAQSQQPPSQYNYNQQTQQPVSIQQIPLSGVQSQPSNIQNQALNSENTPHNQPMNTQPNVYTPSNANNTQLSYSPINLIYQNPQPITEKPFSAISQNPNSQTAPQQSYLPVQPFQLQTTTSTNQPSQGGIGSSDNLQNNSSATSAQFNIGQSQQPLSQQDYKAILAQYPPITGGSNNNGQSVQDSIQQAINYSNSVLQRNPNF